MLFLRVYTPGMYAVINHEPFFRGKRIAWIFSWWAGLWRLFAPCVLHVSVTLLPCVPQVLRYDCQSRGSGWARHLECIYQDLRYTSVMYSLCTALVRHPLALLYLRPSHPTLSTTQVNFPPIRRPLLPPLLPSLRHALPWTLPNAPQLWEHSKILSILLQASRLRWSHA